MTEIALLSTSNMMPDEPLTVVTPAPAPTADDVGRFELALAQPFAVQPVPGEPPPAIAAMDSPATLGDRILSTVDGMRAYYRDTLDHMGATLEAQKAPGDSVAVADMMRMMVEVQKLTLQEEMLSKLAGKTSQNLDTLLKGQ